METPSQHPFDWNAKLVRFFLNNTRLVWLLIISITIGGVVSLLSLRREGFPAVSPKMIVVQTVYPGASAEEMERQVTGAVENAVKDVKGRKETSSTSIQSCG
jgi:HAE1 family hydrophobic/amphiphilic exporter-1